MVLDSGPCVHAALGVVVAHIWEERLVSHTSTTGLDIGILRQTKPLVTPQPLMRVRICYTLDSRHFVYEARLNLLPALPVDFLVSNVLSLAKTYTQQHTWHLKLVRHILVAR